MTQATNALHGKISLGVQYRYDFGIVNANLRRFCFSIRYFSNAAILEGLVLLNESTLIQDYLTEVITLNAKHTLFSK